jgi:hypothetical protein
MSNAKIEIRETSVGTLSGHLVGLSNIWERELPDEKGMVALRLSAKLSIQNIDTEKLRYQNVFAGSIVSLGVDRYCIKSVEQGESAPGGIILQKLAPLCSVVI